MIVAARSGWTAWAWSALQPWLDARAERPVGPLFCVIIGPTRGHGWSASAAWLEPHRTAIEAGVRRRSRHISSAMSTPSSCCTHGCTPTRAQPDRRIHPNDAMRAHPPDADPDRMPANNRPRSRRQPRNWCLALPTGGIMRTAPTAVSIAHEPELSSQSVSTVNRARRPGACAGEKTRQHLVVSITSQCLQHPGDRCDGGWTQRLTLMLTSIVAGDYLTWVRDPEPPMLGVSLQSVAVSAEPLGDRIEVELCWDDTPPSTRDAAIAAGFPLTPEVALLAEGEAPSPTVTSLLVWTRTGTVVVRDRTYKRALCEESCAGSRLRPVCAVGSCRGSSVTRALSSQVSARRPRTKAAQVRRPGGWLRLLAREQRCRYARHAAKQGRAPAVS